MPTYISYCTEFYLTHPGNPELYDYVYATPLTVKSGGYVPEGWYGYFTGGAGSNPVLMYVNASGMITQLKNCSDFDCRSYTYTASSGSTPGPGPSPSPSPTVYSIQLYNNSYETYITNITVDDACNNRQIANIYYLYSMIGSSSPNIGDYLYLDSNRISPAPEGYYGLGDGTYIYVTFNGYISDYAQCFGYV